jgi:ATP-dependent protease HslVU (ClpYQ) ATPase subunit
MVGMIKTTHMLTLPEGVYENIMDKVADALMESMSKEFEAMKQKSFAKKELREKLVRILSEGNQKQK